MANSRDEHSLFFGGDYHLKTLVQFAFTIIVIFLAVSPALAKSEREQQEQLCMGMAIEWHLPGGARADCLSADYVYEVDFTEKWHPSHRPEPLLCH